MCVCVGVCVCVCVCVLVVLCVWGVCVCAFVCVSLSASTAVVISWSTDGVGVCVCIFPWPQRSLTKSSVSRVCLAMASWTLWSFVSFVSAALAIAYAATETSVSEPPRGWFWCPRANAWRFFCSTHIVTDVIDLVSIGGTGVGGGGHGCLAVVCGRPSTVCVCVVF